MQKQRGDILYSTLLDQFASNALRCDGLYLLCDVMKSYSFVVLEVLTVGYLGSDSLRICRLSQLSVTEEGGASARDRWKCRLRCYGLPMLSTCESVDRGAQSHNETTARCMGVLIDENNQLVVGLLLHLRSSRMSVDTGRGARWMKCEI